MTAPDEPTNSAIDSWEFAGWGRAERITNLERGGNVSHLDQPTKHTLGVWQSTAICGNDITSSVLYVSALSAVYAGVLAPLVLIVVGLVLYLFRKIYAEVGSALPLNGGTYTVLLNTANKRIAAGAAVLTLLSYIATAVISATEAMHYANHIFPVNVLWATVALLAIFAVLNVVGIAESGKVALGIFVFHMVTLTVLSVAAAWRIALEPSLLMENLRLPPPGSIGRAFFFGFAAAMLGISGFESSANFIEEQRSGVFPLTLRNMWIAVMIFNPLMGFLSFGLLPMAEIQAIPDGANDLLAQMGESAAGASLGWWVSLDAVLVLSGAVLTSYVGVTGLVRRMSLDRCLPQMLLRENPWRETNHWIIIGFFLLCTSILFVTSGSVTTLSGVYTLSFLSVMALFAIGNMLLKQKRARLPRAVRASWLGVSVALIAVLIALLGNIWIDPLRVEIFAAYFAIASLAVGIMFLRVQLLRVGLLISRAIVDRVMSWNEWISENVREKIEEINSACIVFFTKGDDDIAVLNKAALYVLTNEQTNHLRVVHVFHQGSEPPRHLAAHLKTIDHLYPQLRVDFIAVRGDFGPELIESLSRRLDVPKNYMFIGTPGDRFPHRIEALGGVRVIL